MENLNLKNCLKIISELEGGAAVEDGVHDKQARFQKLIDGIPAMISHWDVNLVNINANECYSGFFGKTPEEVRGLHFSDLSGVVFKEAQFGTRRALEGKTVSFEAEIAFPDGELRRFQVIYHPEKEADEVRGFFVVEFDVTEQTESVLRFDQMANSIEEVFWMTDLKTGQLLYISPGYEVIWKKPCSTMYENPRSYLADVHPEDLDHLKDTLPKRMQGEFDEVYRVIQPNGKFRWVHEKTYLAKTASGKPIRVIGTVQDITAAKMAELAAVESADLLNGVLNSVSHGVWGLDANGIVTFVNKAGMKLTGYSYSDEVIGHDMHTLVHHSHEDGKPYSRTKCPTYSSLQKMASSRVMSEVFWRKDGTSFPVAYVTTPILKNGHCIGAVVSFEDLTEQRKLERQVEMERLKSIHSSKLASLGEMSAGIAHEINNPLAVISGSVRLLQKYSSDPEKFALKIGAIERSVERISKIVLGLRKFSRAGTAEAFVPVALAKILTECQTLTEARAKRFSTRVEFEMLTQESILCDEVEIEQVVINLINNAIDAVQLLAEKWVKVRLFEDAHQIVLQVRDSGTGVSAEVEHKLFEPFFTTKPVGEGTGLGLSIAKGILDQHGASIQLNRHEGNTCFELRFDRAESVKKSA